MTHDRKGKKKSLIIVTVWDVAATVIENVRTSNYASQYMLRVVLMDAEGRERIGQRINGVEIGACGDTVIEFVCREWVDEVLIALPREAPFPDGFYRYLIEMGVTVHLNLLKAVKQDGHRQDVKKLGEYTVLSSSFYRISVKQAACKRLLDIIGGIVGCVLTLMLVIVIGPVICFYSPGPIFFVQERVGKNGRRFFMYKFRSMYPDAEERKKELTEKNQVKDGMMFKIENDPRIIGGERGIGGFIRKYSLDEFPQFWNVLKGEMSLIGSRPPTVDEWMKYEWHHRIRLATKPGITGLWQISGRSKIKDFEEVVRLDKEYVDNWSLKGDIRILVKTVKAVVTKDGAC
ncbi:MAG: sugar transferase [Hungatella sp.]|nr:sugar transferase [Hungatella sp.]